MSIRRKWLKVVFLLMTAGASLTGPMNPEEIEAQMRIMNDTVIETSDEDHKGDGNKDPSEIPCHE